LTERRRVVHGLHQQLTSYGSTYGKLGGIVVALLFFDVTALIFSFGA
jgi:uncharacterized BrkB/YihY/UPF0761 family membrane protein